MLARKSVESATVRENGFKYLNGEFLIYAWENANGEEIFTRTTKVGGARMST